MKTLFIFLFISTLLISCSKPSIPDPPNGNYYLSVSGNWSSAFANGDIEYDFILPVSFENDSVQIKQYSFPLSAFNLSNGTGTSTINTSLGKITLSFSNNFNDLSLEEDLDMSLAGGGSMYNYVGNRTNLPPTDPNDQSHLVSMSGMYDLNLYELNTNSNVDTSYNGGYQVIYQGSPINPAILVNGNQRNFYEFHSYYQIDRTNYDQINQENLNEIASISWQNDSINYQYSNIIQSIVTQSTDTIIYNYSGSKL